MFTQKCLQDDVKPKIIMVNFDKGLLDNLKSAAIKFWFEHLLPEILNKRPCGESAEDSAVNDEMECSVSETKITCMHCAWIAILHQEQMPNMRHTMQR